MMHSKETILKELKRFYAELQRMKFAHDPKIFEDEIKRLECDIRRENNA